MGVVSSFSQREILREREEVEDTATSKVVACPYTEVQEESFFFLPSSHDGSHSSFHFV